MVVTYPRPKVAVVEFRGEHDMSTREETATLFKELLASNQLVVADVSEARFIDSSFINNLFIADGFARREGKRFRLRFSTDPMMRRVLEISRVLELGHASNREEALR